MYKIKEKMNKIFHLAHIVIFFGLFISACGNNDEPKNNNFSGDTSQNQNAGADNYTDVAVTGSVTDIKLTSAIINGYINIDKAPIVNNSDYDMGVCYSTSASMDETGVTYVSTNTLTGRNLSVVVSPLEPYTEYYYQTYLRIKINGESMLFKGEVLKFSTLDFSNAAEASVYSSDPIEGVVFRVGVADDFIELSEKEDFKFSYGIYYAFSEEKLISGNYSSARFTDGFCSVPETKGQTVYYYPFTKVGNVVRTGEMKSYASADKKYPADARTKIEDIWWNTCAFYFYLNEKTMLLATGFGAYFSTDPLLLENIHISKQVYSLGDYKRLVLTELQPETTYYYQPYCSIGGVTIYGEIESFETTAFEDSLLIGAASFKADSNEKIGDEIWLTGTLTVNFSTTLPFTLYYSYYRVMIFASSQLDAVENNYYPYENHVFYVGDDTYEIYNNNSTVKKGSTIYYRIGVDLGYATFYTDINQIQIE